MRIQLAFGLIFLCLFSYQGRSDEALDGKIGFLVKKSNQLGNGHLTSARSAMGLDELVTIESDRFRDEYDLWSLFGTPVGFVGSDEPGLLELFLRARLNGRKTGLLAVVGSSPHERARTALLTRLWKLAGSPTYTFRGESLSTKGLSLFVQAKLSDEVALGVSLLQIISYADRILTNANYDLYVMPRSTFEEVRRKKLKDAVSIMSCDFVLGRPPPLEE